MKNEIFTALTHKLPGVRKHVLMAKHTTFKIGGSAEYFFLARSQEDVIGAIQAARALNLPVFMFGGGSNLLVSDEGIKGLVVKIDNSEISLVENNIIAAGAGADMAKLVSFSISKSLKGLEWAGGLPGTFGGAIRGNAGAFGGETKDSVLQVTALDDNLNIRTFNNAECQFSYRNSVFKQRGWIILSAKLQLEEGNQKELKAIADSRIQYRTDKHPLEYPSAGSIFKNVPVETLKPAFQEEFADKVKQDPFPIVPAAWFIIGAGLTGMRVGGAQISTKHSNYIVNTGNATAQDVLQLVENVKKIVKEKYDIALEMEVQFVKH